MAAVIGEDLRNLPANVWRWALANHQGGEKDWAGQLFSSPRSSDRVLVTIPPGSFVSTEESVVECGRIPGRRNLTAAVRD